MYIEHPDLSREYGKSRLDEMIAAAEVERRAAKIGEQTTIVDDVRETLANWVSDWRKTPRRVAPKGI
jgi:hypothetical protein